MNLYTPFFETEIDYYSPLLESTFSLDKDVDYIYNKVFDKIIKDINRSNFKEVQNAMSIYERIGYFYFDEMPSLQLSSKDSKKGNEVYPITIKMGIHRKGSSYNALNKEIVISLNVKALKAIVAQGWGVLKKNMNNSKFKLLKGEFSEVKIKSSIAHELSHWLDDAIHNHHILNLSNLAHTLGDKSIMLLKQKNVNMTYFEIEAQIHGIKNLKRENKDSWDSMTMEDMFWKYTSLAGIIKVLYNSWGKEVADIWQKNLMKRMAREGLLGKNMKNFATYEMITESYHLVY